MKEDLWSYWKARQTMVEEELEGFLPESGPGPEILRKAMRYTLFAGGKRLRPILAIMGYEIAGGENVRDEILPQAAALELIHTFTLIHDDLPAMDDDDMRRGKPSNHKVFGEGIAILAGDALLVEGIRLFVQGKLPHDVKLRMLNELLSAIGVDGIMGGQTMDLIYEGKQASPEMVDYIHSRKTGVFIQASLTIGAMGAQNERLIPVYREIGRLIGLAFQITDDVLDVTGDEKTLGKPVRHDQSAGKSTYPALYGVEKSMEHARNLVNRAIEIAHYQIGPEIAWPLIELSKFIIERNH